MNATIIGSQFGDEGKGSVVDLFGNAADVVVRYQGGDNAGHTVTVDGNEYKLRLVPSGVVRGKLGVLGRGCVIDLKTLFEEIETLREEGLSPEVCVSGRAHVVLPYHRVLDQAEETSKSGKRVEVGTTGNGIGPAYEDKAGRRGIRIAELLHPDLLRERLEYTVPKMQRIAEDVFGISTGDAFDVDLLSETFEEFGDRLHNEEMVIDEGSFLRNQQQAGKTLLFESAQGTSIDIDHGNYPYVTSSNPTAGGAVVGSGVSPATVSDGEIIGVVKSYLSRVGRGPMPTEMADSTASKLREKVGGFGTVTGRPRRIGWLDLPLLRLAAQVNGFTGFTLNHVDALGGIDELRVCEAYEYEGEILKQPPMTTVEWAQCTPQYREFEPWDDQDWNELAVDGYDTLPKNARTYIEYVRSELDLPIYAVSIGPERDETIVLKNPLSSSTHTEPKTGSEVRDR